MSITTKPRNYVNNSDLLLEIHRSKITFCSFQDPDQDQHWDLALKDISQVIEDSETQNSATVAYHLYQARVRRADYLLRHHNEVVTVDSVDLTELVFRVPTWEHIPLAPPKAPKNPPKTQDIAKLFDFDPDLTNPPLDLETPESRKHVRLNFAPFFHYRLTSDGEPVIVGKSHWKGDVDTGEFNRTHGQITEKLASMMMTMVERYSTRGNWRSYSYVDEMRGNAIIALINGGLQFDECRGSNPFAFFTTVITNAFTGVLLNERKVQNTRDDLLEMNGLNPSFTRQYANSYNFADKHGPVEVIKHNE